MMDTVTVSPKFQVVIPAEIRNFLHIRPGEKMVVMEKDGIIHVIPVNNIRSMKGRYKGISTKGLRDEADRY